MFDFPSFRPTVGDHKRFNEPFCKILVALAVGQQTDCPPGADHKLANTLIDEFPCRPHWTKNSRDVIARAKKNLDPDVSNLSPGTLLRYRKLTFKDSIYGGSTRCGRDSIWMGYSGVSRGRYWDSTESCLRFGAGVIYDGPVYTCLECILCFAFDLRCIC